MDQHFLRRALATLDADSLPRRRIDALLLLAAQQPLETTATVAGLSADEVRRLKEAAQRCGIAHALVFGSVSAEVVKT